MVNHLSKNDHLEWHWTYIWPLKPLNGADGRTDGGNDKHPLAWKGKRVKKKNLQNSHFLPIFVIKDPLIIRSKKKIKILLPQLLGQYSCARSSQVSERLDENWGSLFDLKKGWRWVEVFGEFVLSCYEASCTTYLLLLSCLLPIGQLVSIDKPSSP